MQRTSCISASLLFIITKVSAARTPMRQSKINKSIDQYDKYTYLKTS
ncbi:hypothetical protein DT075_10210 [Bacillus licheniformis]|nr:hypothetical protein DT075_10210 [Bacillus licheniformis]